MKRGGTRNETHIVWADGYPIHDGLHEAIVSEEIWRLAQKKRENTCFANEKLKDSDHAHILSGILRCPCCGKGLYGNVARGKTKDSKIRYYPELHKRGTIAGVAVVLPDTDRFCSVEHPFLFLFSILCRLKKN